MMKFQKTTVAFSVLCATAMLTACGGGSDQDSQASTQTSFTGLVIDDPISGAYVYPDLNGNGLLDSFEIGGTTTSSGGYSFQASSTGTMRLTSIGGTDTATLESWDGTLSGIYDPDVNVNTVNLTPVTTMVASVVNTHSTTLEEANRRVLQAIYGTSLTTAQSSINLNTYDYTSSTTDNDALTMRKAAVTIAQTVEAANRVLNNAAENVSGVKLGSSGVQANTTGASSFVYDSLATNLLSTTPTTSVLTNLHNETLTTVISNASTKFQEKILETNTNVSSSALQTALDAAAAAARAAAEATADVANIVLATASNANQFKAASIVTATVVEKADQGATDSTLTTYATNVTSDTDVIDAVNTAVTAGNVVDVGLLEDGLGDGSSVGASITDSSLQDISSGSDIWSNQFLSMSGKNSANSERGRVIMFFNSYSDSDEKGDVNVCYAFYKTSDDPQTQTGRIEAKWTKVGEEVVEVTSQYGSFQIKAYRVQPVPSADTSKFLGLGTAGTPGSSTYGNFLFTSSAFDQNATWYSDIASDSSGVNSATGWGLRNFTTAPTNPETCKSFTADGVNGGNAFLTTNVF